MNTKVESVEGLSAKVAELESKLTAMNEMILKTGTYKQLQESISQAVQNVLAGPRLSDIVMERVRSISLGRDDVSAYITRSAASKTAEYMAGPDGTKLLQDTVLQHRGMQALIDQNVTAVLQKREFITALSAGFRAAIMAEPIPLAALVDALAADEKGLLAKSLINNQAFMDKNTHSILTKLRDSLA